MSMALLFTNATILPMTAADGRPRTFAGAVGIEGNRIRLVTEEAAAAEALRELILPNMGMDTVKSQVSSTRRPRPEPSLPMTMAAGPFRSA